MKKVYGWLAALVLIPWRYSLRYRVVGEVPVPSGERGFGVAFLHAHQIAGIFGVELPRSWVMVSRSADGDLLIPTLSLRGIRVARGSSRKGGKDKGGREALNLLMEQVQQGAAGFLAIDGPQGPRGQAKRGIATLAKRMDVPIYPVLVLPARRWILSKTWDRMQLPKPFTTVSMYWGPGIFPKERSIEELQGLVSSALAALEQRYDRVEAEACAGLAAREGC